MLLLFFCWLWIIRVFARPERQTAEISSQTWRNELLYTHMPLPSFPHQLCCCHARPSSFGPGPVALLWTKRQAHYRTEPSEDLEMMFSSWITSHRLALVSFCRGGECHSSRAVRPSVTVAGRSERPRSLNFLSALQLHMVLSMAENWVCE